MPGEQEGYVAFRARLDAVLRQRQPEALREFMVAEGQWQPDTTTDPERAQWMMIAGSPSLRDLHGEAEAWLVAHGFGGEAAAILRRSAGGRGAPGGPRGPSGPSAGRGGGHNHLASRGGPPRHYGHRPPGGTKGPRRPPTDGPDARG